MQCRTHECEHEATQGHYCDECKEFTPICPECGCGYGEHHPTCEVADGYNDTLEGPWETRADAEAFAKAEVGKPWQIAEGEDELWYVMAKDED
jgi:hypothetical protein